MIYICNSFSLSMLPAWRREDVVSTGLVIQSMTDGKGFLAAMERLGDVVVSAVGHADTAALFSTLLGRKVEMNRISVSLGGDDVVLVGQLSGPRPPEGATTLPAGAEIQWLAVRLATEPGEEFWSAFPDNGADLVGGAP